MRIAILEWVCGGGLIDVPAEQISSTLVAEAKSMLATLVHGFTNLQRTGDVANEVVVPIDERLVGSSDLCDWSSKVELRRLNFANCIDLANAWTEATEGCDFALVIAPETNNVLLEITEHLRSAGALLINGSSDFLAAAGDKLATARAFRDADLPHPPTRRWSNVDASWISSVREQLFNKSRRNGWVAKPLDGAGSEGLMIFGDEDFETFASSTATKVASNAAKQIVQPWIDGLPFSCSGIADASGRCHWLPLVSQDFQTVELDGYTHLVYLGCTLGADSERFVPPVAILDTAIEVLGGSPLGWISVDLVYDLDADEWTIIEVNPRCTTSLSGLAKSYSGNLVAELLRATDTSYDGPSGTFSATQFRL